MWSSLWILAVVGAVASQQQPLPYLTSTQEGFNPAIYTGQWYYYPTVFTIEPNQPAGYLTYGQQYSCTRGNLLAVKLQAEDGNGLLSIDVASDLHSITVHRSAPYAGTALVSELSLYCDITGNKAEGGNQRPAARARNLVEI